jgi:hypothetical protein
MKSAGEESPLGLAGIESSAQPISESDPRAVEFADLARVEPALREGEAGAETKGPAALSTAGLV